MKKKKIMFFDDTLSGHHLEYLNHLYMRAISEKGKEFIFALPDDFAERKKNFDWPDASHVRFVFFKDSWTHPSIIRSAWHGSRKIASLLKETESDAVFLISLVKYMPFLPFFLPRKIKVMGIVYNIYLYSWKGASCVRKIVNALINFLYAKSKCFTSVFILNDSVAAAYLNKMWRSDHFTFLPDPYWGGESVVPNEEHGRDKITFLHFGGMARRKGTLEILRALVAMSSEQVQDFRFIFAGCVYREIKEDFYSLVGLLQDKVELQICDDFVPYSQIEAYCAASDYILVPYENTSSSSGCLAYAAKYSVPVIGPRQGMLGKLIRRYHLGIVLNSVRAEGLTLFLQKCKTLPYERKESGYLATNSVKNFQDTIFATMD